MTNKINFKTNNNTLPKVWCVWNDKSQLFKDTVIEYINFKTGDAYSGCDNQHYGIDFYEGNCIEEGEPFGTLLSIKEFIACFELNDVKKPTKNKPMSIKELEKQKAAIEKQIAELKKPKFVVGKWYQANDVEGPFKLLKYKIEGNDLNWSEMSGGDFIKESVKNLDHSWDMNKVVPVSEDKILKLLKAEAKKRGLLKGGNYFISADGEEGGFNVDAFDFYYDINRDEFISHGYLLYSNGKWATLVKPPIKIGKYKVTKSGSTIEIGCKSIPLATIKSIYNMMTQCDWDTITLGGIKVSIDKLDEIIKMK